MSITNAIEVKNLVKTYGDVYALKNVNLNIADGEYFVLLGPSGGGKTTLLRSIGGFIRPDSGTVGIKGKNVDHLPPDKRPTSMVFQGFALFPHMSVAENIGYGLKLKSIEKDIKSGPKSNKTELSKIVAEKLAKKAQEKKITKIYFDRGVYKYHGRIKVFAETLRKNGMEF